MNDDEPQAPKIAPDVSEKSEVPAPKHFFSREMTAEQIADALLADAKNVGRKKRRDDS